MAHSSHNLFPDTLIVALGGKPIHPEGINGTGEEQFEFAREASKALLTLPQDITELVFAHLEDAYEALCGTAGLKVRL